MLSGVKSGDMIPVESVGIGDCDSVGEIYYTNFKENIESFKYNKLLDIGDNFFGSTIPTPRRTWSHSSTTNY